MEAVLFAIGVLVVFLIIYVPLVLWNAFVMTKIWSWLIIPAWHVDPISVSQAIGVSILVGMLTHKYENEKNNKEIGKQLIMKFVFSLLILVLSYCWSLVLF